MRAGRAAVAAGVRVRVLRYYEGLGLMAPSRVANGYRDYSEDDVRAVAQIRDKRLTLIVEGDRTEHVFYPIFPPSSHAEEVLAWLQPHSETGS